MTCLYLSNVCDILSKILSTHMRLCHANPTAVSSPRNRQDARGYVQKKKTKALLCSLLMFFKFFLIWTIFKVFIEFVTILLLFYGVFLVFFFLATRHVGSQLSPPGIGPLPSRLEREVLTTGPPGKFRSLVFNAHRNKYSHIFSKMPYVLLKTENSSYQLC